MCTGTLKCEIIIINDIMYNAERILEGFYSRFNNTETRAQVELALDLRLLAL